MTTSSSGTPATSVSLSDGSHASLIGLSSTKAPSGTCVVDGNVWIVCNGDRYASVRDAVSGELRSRVDLMTDDAHAIARVGPRVWVATRSNKLFIFGSDGILLGVLQPNTIPVVTQFFPLRGGNGVVTAGGTKDFHLWNVTQFTVERTFLGRTPGETITSVVSANRSNAALVATSTNSIRLWHIDGSLLAEVLEGGVTAICLPSSQDDGASVWVAQPGWVTLFSLATTRRTTQFRRDKTIPCALVQQLFVIDTQQVGTLDSEGLVTLWGVDTLLPLRSFKVTSQLQMATPLTAGAVMCMPAVEKRIVSMWCVGETSALLWDGTVAVDAAFRGGPTDGDAAEQSPIDMEREEVRFLRKKLKYLESMSTLYRQKVGLLLRDSVSLGGGGGGGSPAASTPRSGNSQKHHHALMSAFQDLDRGFARSLEQWDDSNRDEEPILDPTAQIASIVSASSESMEVTEYWKRKYYHMVEDFSNMRRDHEGLIAMINDEHAATTAAGAPANALGLSSVPSTGNASGKPEGGGTTASTAPPSRSIDGRRAMFLTRVIKEKNELRERVMQLSDDVMKLRGLLKNQALGITSSAGGESSLDAIDALRQESNELRQELYAAREHAEQAQQALADAQAVGRQNQLLKQRVKKMKADLDIAQIQLSETSAAMQRDYQSLVDALAQVEGKLRQRESDARNVDVTLAKADLENTSLRTELAQQQQVNDSLRKELAHREKVEQSTLEHLQRELTLMCQSLDDRDARISELLDKNHDLVNSVRDLEAANRLIQNTAVAKEEELVSLRERLESLENVMKDRKTYAKAVDEIQGRLEMVVEELRHGFTPLQFAANISELEGRIANLFALESQLRQKDDIIAMRDDEIAVLKEHAASVEQQVQQVSSVFSQLPRSVDEVEQLLVEVDEYRRRLGNDLETQEMIQLRLLELRARRDTTSSPPFAVQLSPNAISR